LPENGKLGINMEYLHQVNMEKQSLEASKQTYRKKTLSGKEKEDAETTAMNKSKAGFISFRMVLMIISLSNCEKAGLPLQPSFFVGVNY
jgi:hypothetical protein